VQSIKFLILSVECNNLVSQLLDTCNQGAKNVTNQVEKDTT